MLGSNLPETCKTKLNNVFAEHEKLHKCKEPSDGTTRLLIPYLSSLGKFCFMSMEEDSDFFPFFIINCVIWYEQDFSQKQNSPRCGQTWKLLDKSDLKHKNYGQCTFRSCKKQQWDAASRPILQYHKLEFLAFYANTFTYVKKWNHSYARLLVSLNLLSPLELSTAWHGLMVSWLCFRYCWLVQILALLIETYHCLLC